MAIADAVLQHLVQEVGCKTLFITHYPLVATELEKKFPEDIQNLHMGFSEARHLDCTREITFLYKLTPGIASGSFGIECGRLAALPESVLEKAEVQAAGMQAKVKERHSRSKCVILACVLLRILIEELRLRKAIKLLTQIVKASSEETVSEIALQIDSLCACVGEIQQDKNNTTIDLIDAMEH